MPSEKFNDAILGLCEAFGRAATEATVGAYAIGLRGLTDEQVVAAAAVALERNRFMPVPAELRELAMSDGAGFEVMSDRAFDALRQAIRDHGADYTVCFADGAINAAVRQLGGWYRVCSMPRDEFDKWFSKDFRAAYLGIVRAGASEDQMRPLQGQLSQDNAWWNGQINPRTGHVYRLEDMGGGERWIGVDYLPALPAPAPEARPAIGHGAAFGLRMKDASGKPMGAVPPYSTAPLKALPAPRGGT